MLYERYRDPAMLRPVKQRADSVIAFPAQTKMHIKAKNGSNRWSWCDALSWRPRSTPCWRTSRATTATGNS